METESKNRELGGHLNEFWKGCSVFKCLILNKVEMVNTECSNLTLIA